LYDIAATIVQLGAASLSIIIPYFGYSTMERAVQQGEVVKAKTRALLLSTIPSATTNIKIFLFDLHSEGIPFYFDNHVRTAHIYCKQVIKQAIDIFITEPFVLAATDAGRAKWVESLAEEWQMQAAFAYKTRVDGSTTKITGVNADIKNKIVVIYDDMIRTGGTLMQAAEAYHNLGAKAIYVATTHGIFCGNALDKIQAQGIIKKVIATDTHTAVHEFINHPILHIQSVSNLIANLIK
jgi:ribose-phosphate pyrophosphokinase